MHIEIKIKPCRYDISSLDQTKQADCYGYIQQIGNDRILLKNVFVESVDAQGNPMSLRIDHIWLFAHDILKGADCSKVQIGKYIRFKGNPYLYTRKNNTKDWAFNNCSNKQIRVIKEEEYRKHGGMEAIS